MNTINNQNSSRGVKRLNSSIACLIAVTLIGTSFVSGCHRGTQPEAPATPLPIEEVTPGEETTEPATEKPPEIPPASTFIIDFNDFLSPKPSSSGLGGT